jgi:hypothetical protein
VLLRVVLAAVGEVGSSDARRNAVRRAAVAAPVRSALVALVALLKEQSTKLQARPFRKPHCVLDAPRCIAKRAALAFRGSSRCLAPCADAAQRRR